MLSTQAMGNHVFVWKICGLWSYAEQSRLYKVYKMFCWIIFYFMPPFLMSAKIPNAENVFEIIDIIFFLPTALGGLKGYLIINSRKRVSKLFKALDELDESNLLNDEYKQVIKETTINIRRLAWLPRMLYCSTATIMGFVPLFDSKPTLIWRIWFPFDYESNVYIYRTLHLFQWVATLYFATLNTSLDIFGGNCYSLIAGHLKILGLRLSRLGETTESTKKSPLGKVAKKSNALQENEGELIKCVKTHLLILNLAADLNVNLSAMYLLQFAITGLTICGSEFRLTTVNLDTNIIDFVMLLMYICCMTVQLAVACYCASGLTHHSKLVPGSIYNSYWIEQSPRFKKAMLTFVERAMNPLEPMAGGLFIVGLPLFVSIMKTSYSMFAFLKRMEK